MLGVHAKPKEKPNTNMSKKTSPINKKSLQTFISTFDLIQTANGQLELTIQNVNGEKKKAELNKIEEYEEFTRYSLPNPFGSSSHILNLYVFQKIKPTLQESKDSSTLEHDMSDLRIDLVVLMDGTTKKTVSSKGVFYHNNTLVADGTIDDNAKFKIIDNLSKKLRNLKLNEVKVTKDMLGSDKRRVDMELKVAQAGKQLSQKLNLNLLNMKLTPVKSEVEIEDMEQESEFEVETQGES